MKSEADSNLYYLMPGGESLILVLYVDDLFFIGNKNLIVGYKRELGAKFKIKDLGLLHYFLGI